MISTHAIYRFHPILLAASIGYWWSLANQDSPSVVRTQSSTLPISLPCQTMLPIISLTGKSKIQTTRCPFGPSDDLSYQFVPLVLIHGYDDQLIQSIPSNWFLLSISSDEDFVRSILPFYPIFPMTDSDIYSSHPIDSWFLQSISSDRWFHPIILSISCDRF